MYDTPLCRDASEAVEAGLAFLLASQSRDGLWRDYELKPGRSEAWSTAWFGWCLAHFTRRAPVAAAVQRASVALTCLCTPTGWGYNRLTEPDGDSTAWGIRFLSVAGVAGGQVAGTQLAKYLDPAGRAHTFLDPAQGAWAEAHADVTAMVGLALLGCSSRSELVARVRAAVLYARNPDGIWSSFWWATDVYATVWSVSFLRRSGGLPLEVWRGLASWVSGGQNVAGPLDAALSLLLCLELWPNAMSLAEVLVHELVDKLQNAQGWPGTALLLVPPRYEGDVSSSVGPHADVCGYISTATACLALARWARQ